MSQEPERYDDELVIEPERDDGMAQIVVGPPLREQIEVALFERNLELFPIPTTRAQLGDDLPTFGIRAADRG